MKHFIRGMCSVLQLFPSEYRRNEVQMPYIEHDVSKRIANIWERVGVCSKNALSSIGNELSFNRVDKT